ncbi:acyl-CoA synthetase FdrA [Silvimonas amylolytica]|nr:acyl-CoA synthetase FdrA [Silvimonas amylolytica]
MNIRNRIFPNMYQDSVSLMQISAQIAGLDGIEQASVVMGTPANIIQLQDAGLGQDFKAGPNDLIIAVRGAAAACDTALELAQTRLTAKPASDEGDIRKVAPASLAMGVETMPEASLALISVPGDYAAAEAIKALQLGLNVMMFSDNVPMAQEVEIKQLANRKNRIVMGPDCGTAIINGIPLGFANVVKRGAIGVVAASGTGLQEVTCRIDQLGEGVSQALGTGGHDLHEEVGGISMLYGLQALIEDAATKVIVLVSKPPAPAVADKIMARASAAGKPVVVHFLGAPRDALAPQGITFAHTLGDAAEVAVAKLHNQPAPASIARLADADAAKLTALCAVLPASRKDIRGVFAGGTFCFEAQLICQQAGFVASSNTPVAGNKTLADLWTGHGHTVVDMGDDAYTRGRPHPMIDPTLRNARILSDMADPATAVVLFDLVLGYGAAAAPADALLQALQSAPRGPVLVALVCGTEADPQVRQRQVDALRAAGVLVAGSNAEAAVWASKIARQQANR